MNKMFMVVRFLLIATSLYGDILADQRPEQQRITFNFNIRSKEDVFVTLDTLTRILPIIYMQEVGTDEAKRRMAIEFDKRLERTITSSFICSVIHSISAKFLEQRANESFSEKVRGFVVIGKMIEDTQVCGKLHIFLQTSEGKDFLNMYEIMIKNDFNTFPFFLTFFYVLRQIAHEIGQEEVKSIVL